MLGQRLHNFAIMRLLGEGGMSSVYEAEHTLIRRKVAVKVLRSELSADGVQVQRFFNEARATSSIRHPNIVEVIDVGRLPDGVPYLVMELLEGESLAERLERVRSVEIPSALEFASQAACVLEAAHALDIIHRDLKPDNLFLVPDPRRADRELVKVLDFGIAKLRGELAVPPFDTLVGAVLGTPPYMSPEQCRGVPEEIDEGTDIYALGIILYEMICGRPPFLACGAGELMMLHMTELPEPPSQYCPEIPDALEDAILCALEKRREDRFASMTEFNATLAEIAAAIGVVDPYAVRRSSPAAQSGTRPATTPPASTFESDTTRTAPKLGPPPERIGAVTRRSRRVPSPDSASGVVPLEPAAGLPLRGRGDDVSGITVQLAEREPSSIEVDSSVAAGAASDVPAVPPAFAAHDGGRHRAWLGGTIASVGVLAAVGVALLAFGRSPSSETARMPARTPQVTTIERRLPPPPAAELPPPRAVPPVAPVPAVEPDRILPLSAAGGLEPSRPAPGQAAGAPTDPDSPRSTEPLRAALEPAPAPTAGQRTPGQAPLAPGAPAALRASHRNSERSTEDEAPLARPAAGVGAARSAAVGRSNRAAAIGSGGAARTATSGSRASSPRSSARADSPRARRAAAAAPAGEETNTERPAAPLVAEPQPIAAVAPAPPVEPGYLNLDSAPWSDVFLGQERLGTTPLIGVPLPPGKHLLTLRNPELDTSTSYQVEIVSGKTVSRLVGWERR